MATESGVGFMGLASNEFAKIKTDAALYAESVHRLLNTTPGDRPWDPEFGCGLKLLLFDGGPGFVARSSQYLIQQAIARYEPRLEINTMAFEYDTDLKKLKITIRFVIKKTQEVFDVIETLNAA